MGEVINWQQYFMAQALLAAKRSKDPSTQVGAIIVGADNRIIGTGWNGMPKTNKLYSNNDFQMPWTKDSSDPLESKYLYVVHAEPNAIHHASASVNGSTMYLTWFPCSECAKVITQSGIKKLVYLKENSTDRYRVSMEAAKRIFNFAGVQYTEYRDSKEDLLISFK